MNGRIRGRRGGRIAAAAAALSMVAVQGAAPGAVARAPDQGLNANERATADAIVRLLTARTLDGKPAANPAPVWAKDAVDMVVTFADGTYRVYAERGAITFTRKAKGPGWEFDVKRRGGANPLAEQDPTALSTLAEEFAARSSTEPPGCALATNPDCRFFVRHDATTYPNAYERIVAAFDSPRTGDLVVIPWNDGPDGSKGGHGHLGVTQSRSTLLVSGRGARRAALPAQIEAALGIQTVDLAPTVAQALGVRPYSIDTGKLARSLNGNPSTTALLGRQDGEVIDALLEQPTNVFVVVVDGLEPEDVSPLLTPTLWNLVQQGQARRYTKALANMVSETNPNHTAMMTGAYGDVSGIVANTFFNRRSGQEEAMERPSLILAETLFDSIERSKPWLRTAAVMGKEKLKRLFDCTPSDADPSACGTSTDNPERIPVTHMRPDYLLGASTTPDPNQPIAEPASGSGYALDDQVMDQAIALQGAQDPDFTFINLGTVDGIQHLTGAGSPASRATIVEADRNVGKLVSYLREAGKWQHSVVLVLADHSFQSTGDPVALEAAGTSIAINNPLTPHLGGSMIALDEMFAGACPSTAFTAVADGGSAFAYIADQGYDPYAPDAELTDKEKGCLKELRGRALAQPGVDQALYRIPVEGSVGLAKLAHLDWNLDTPRAGELLVTADDSHSFVGTRATAEAAFTGNHGGATARPIPFIVASGGSFLARGTDGKRLARPIDVAPTVAWLLDAAPPAQAQGRVLREAFAVHPSEATYGEPVANRAAIFIFDANNSVDVHTLLETRDPRTKNPFVPCAVPPDPDDPVPNLRCLASRGTLTRYGTTAAFPSVTFPNHNTIGSGAYPGHNGIVNNRWYERTTQRSEHPIDPQAPENPVYFWTESLLSKEVETLHEAVHRTFGDWMGPTNADPTKAGGAFTAAVDEPSSRGADFASLEVTGRAGEPLFAAHFPRADELVADTNAECLQQMPEQYGQESAIDHLGQGQAQSLFEDPTHPAPKYLINNFSLTDGAGHTFGPHTSCTLSAYRDADRRLGQILDSMRAAGVFGETLIIVTGDHGMENQRVSAFSGSIVASELATLGYKLIQEDNFLYLMSLDVSAQPVTFTKGQQTSLTVTVRDDDTGDPIGGALVTVRSGSVSAEGTTPDATAPSRATLPGPRKVPAVLNDAEDAAGADLQDYPTVENPLRAYTDSSGQATITFTPAEDTATVTVTHESFNARTIELASTKPAGLRPTGSARAAPRVRSEWLMALAAVAAAALTRGRLFARLARSART